MGTVFDQPERNFRRSNKQEVILTINMIKEISSETSVPISDIIELLKVMEMERKNDLYVDNGDAFDEQVSGFAEIIRTLKTD